MICCPRCTAHLRAWRSHGTLTCADQQPAGPVGSAARLGGGEAVVHSHAGRARERQPVTTCQKGSESSEGSAARRGHSVVMPRVHIHQQGALVLPRQGAGGRGFGAWKPVARVANAWVRGLWLARPSTLPVTCAVHTAPHNRRRVAPLTTRRTAPEGTPSATATTTPSAWPPTAFLRLATPRTATTWLSCSLTKPRHGPVALMWWWVQRWTWTQTRRA